MDDEQRRRDTEEGGRNATLHHQPKGSGEMLQIRGHRSQPGVYNRESQVNVIHSGDPALFGYRYQWMIVPAILKLTYRQVTMAQQHVL